MRTNALAIPFMTLLLVAVISLNIPVIRDIIVFAYLSFVPGFVILKLFKLKELTLLKTFLISVGLSLFASMLVGLFVDELYLIVGLSKPLSIIPLTTAMSTFTLIVFFINYKRDFSINLVSLDELWKLTRSYLPLVLLLIILPILSIVGALYADVPIMIILCLSIAVLCVLSVASKKLIPSKFYPLLIFSISISILLLNLLMSKYTIGDDANIEFYVFKITQIRGYWGPISAVTNPGQTLFFNSMLSVTVLPNVYSALMGLQNELLFKILYSFIFSLVPIALYDVYKNETGKLIGLLSALFFVFTAGAFFGELISVNRQIVAEFFLVLSIFLWLDKTLPIKEKRILLIIFGLAIAVSHYSIAIIYLIFISCVVIISSIKPRFDDTFNSFTILAIFGVTFLWYAFTTSSIITPIINSIQTALNSLGTFHYSAGAGSVGAVTSLPQVFTTASWFNLVISVVENVLLVIGILAVILLSRKIAISDRYKVITIFAAIIFAVSLLFPSFAETLNFTRFYAFTLLFLSPCSIIGALGILKIIQIISRKGRKNQKNTVTFLNKDGKVVLLIVAILLGAYFFSQSGLVNYVTVGEIHSQTFDYYRILTSTNPVAIQYYAGYIHEQDAFSADWLLKNANGSSIVYAAPFSTTSALVSRSLIPMNLMYPLSNTTNPEQGSFVYLDSLNVVKGIIPTPTGSFNTSEITSALNESNLIYSNGNSEIWYAVESR
jgi:uncharacterized membrane protein